MKSERAAYRLCSTGDLLVLMRETRGLSLGTGSCMRESATAAAAETEIQTTTTRTSTHTHTRTQTSQRLMRSH